MNAKLLSTLEGIGAVVVYFLVYSLGYTLLGKYVPADYLYIASAIVTGVANYLWDHYVAPAFPGLNKPTLPTTPNGSN